MKMTKQFKFVLVASIVLCTVCSVFAIWHVADEGMWPTSWPKELEPLRKQSRTLVNSAQAIYEIPFAKREEFEAAWPHILGLKSKQAPLILLSGSDEKLSGTIKASVRILSPRTGSLVTPEGTLNPVTVETAVLPLLVNPESTFYPPGWKAAEAEASVPGGKVLKIGPPWPDYIKSESGALPEYVFYDNGKWAPYDPNAKREPLKDWVIQSLKVKRARIDIELVVDGNIVDLNRISLPADTPIIDKRFKDKHDK